MSADGAREPGDHAEPNGPSATSDLTDLTQTTDTTDTTDTMSGETTMSHDDSTSTGQQFSDPLADPTTDPAADPVTDPVADLETSPTVDPAAATAADPHATTTIPAASTQALPTTSPFRVEPSAPVPDDVVKDASQLPHLPPPSQLDPSLPGPWATPSGTPQTYEPRPALVTVRKGPRPGSIMFGLLTMIVAGWLLAANLTDADVTFRFFGPPMIGAFGGMLLIVGLAGVVAGRLRR